MAMALLRTATPWQDPLVQIRPMRTCKSAIWTIGTAWKHLASLHEVEGLVGFTARGGSIPLKRIGCESEVLPVGGPDQPLGGEVGGSNGTRSSGVAPLLAVRSTSDRADCTSVNGDQAAGDIGRCRREQERGDATELLRLAIAAKRNFL